MRVMIEIDLPDGQNIPRAEDIKRLTDPNWLAEWWHIDDIQESAESLDEELTEEECQMVLKLIGKEHDCHIGINWNTIEHWIEWVIGQRK